MMDFSDQYMPDLGDFWSPAVGDYDVSSTICPIITNVEFPNIDDSTVVYKYQSRVRKEAKQRLKNAEVQILVTSPYEVKTIRVWIQREEKAAELFAYNVGRVEFGVRDIVFKGSQPIENAFGSKHLYEIDLDSVYYDNPYDKRPVYKLAKTDMLNRNRFQVVVQVVFGDNSFSKEFVSAAFYCCTQPKSTAKRKIRTTSDSVAYGKSWNKPELHNNSQVVDYLEANEAVIGTLEVKGTMYSPKQKADIAYHFDVEHTDFEKTLDEGDVVGFNTKANGDPSIIELSSTNMNKLVQVGVISRSAFFEGNTPDDKAVNTDKVCVMGIVKVKLIGKVTSGERIYASTCFPGKAVSESHSSHVDKDLLLGMAMENSEEKDQQCEQLVRCFVSLLCGLNGKYSFDKTRESESRTNLKIAMTIDQKWKELKATIWSWCLIFAFFTLLFCIILTSST